jgi:UPF0042 nucleotide-binding protein
LSVHLNHLSVLVLVAGLSGAGKSTALDVISDLGFYPIDNLPVALLPNFLRLSETAPERFERTVLLLDIDSRKKMTKLMTFLEAHQQDRPKIKIIFLDSTTETIIKRYSETRRPHPGFSPERDKTLADAVERERDRLFPMREIADLVKDTSQLTVHGLKRELKQFIDSLSTEPGRAIRVNFVSFGFKHGLPLDCDLVMDVRFLPNPYFVQHLRRKTGLEEDVRNYVLDFTEAREFVVRYLALLDFLLPHYVYEGKSYLNIGVGCTGGQHRSVVMAEELSRRFAAQHALVSVKHRDIPLADPMFIK